MNAKKLNLFSPLCQTGYGVVGTNVLKQMLLRNISVASFPLGGVHVEQDIAELVHQSIERADSLDRSAPCLKIWHQHDLATTIGRGEYFAIPYFELDTLTDKERFHLRVPDRVLVSSEWHKNVVDTQAEINSTIWNPGVDTSTFCPPEVKRSDGPYRFLVAGKWEVRKGHDILCDIFNSTFGPADNVELLLLTSNPFLSKKEGHRWERLYKDSKLGDKIHIIPHQETHGQVVSLMQQCSCGVFPSRAEGWNLELLECMACGLPVVTFDHTAHSEFCDNKNSYIIKPRSVEPAYDGKWFFGTGNWAKITRQNQKDFGSLMRFCYENRPENPSGVETASNLSWENCVEKLDNIIWG